ncbi:MAG: hypothetical protein ACM37W_17375 [Actinomycetota bacterium]
MTKFIKCGRLKRTRSQGMLTDITGKMPIPENDGPLPNPCRFPAAAWRSHLIG